MIQVFKGVTLNDGRGKKGLFMGEESLRRGKMDPLREIKGWDSEELQGHEVAEGMNGFGEGGVE